MVMVTCPGEVVFGIFSVIPRFLSEAAVPEGCPCFFSHWNICLARKKFIRNRWWASGSDCLVVRMKPHDGKPTRRASLLPTQTAIASGLFQWALLAINHGFCCVSYRKSMSLMVCTHSEGGGSQGIAPAESSEMLIAAQDLFGRLIIMVSYLRSV